MEEKERENHKIKSWHALSIENAFTHFSSGKEGISREEAEKRIEKYGPNTIEEKDADNAALIFLRQFKSGFVYVLVAAALISAAFGKMIDVYVIAAIILLNALMGFVQEYKAEKAMAALKKMVIPTAKVYRSGEFLQIAAKHIVPGDIIFLEEGDRIPADGRIFESRNLRTSEAALTGESSPVPKLTKELPRETDLGDCKNMVWMSTFVAGGKGKALVTATGDYTVFGNIAKDIESVEKVKDHFEEKTSTLAKQMALFAFTGASVIFLLYLFLHGIGLHQITERIEEAGEALRFAVAALVSGIPEGLPTILVVLLAIGATRMAKRNSVIRKLSATETLGVTNHIITDKTGTLTQNTMNVRTILLSGMEEVSVTGEGWIPEGDFYIKEKHIHPLKDSRLEKLLYVAGTCNGAKLTREEEHEDRLKIIGDPTEGALEVLAQKAGLKEEILHEEEKKLDDMPFNSKLKYRASLAVLLGEKEKKQLYVVGAPEEVIANAKYILDKDKVREITKKEKEEMLKRVEGLTEKAMRTIGLAYKEVSEDIQEVHTDLIQDLILTGVVGMVDPPRPEVKESLEKAHKAGIRVIMATGDHKGTALAIARETGIVKSNREKVLTEKDLLEMSDEQFENAVRDVDVFARITPHMKLKIAKTIQKKYNAVVAMTGDGVNDAPAVKQADIGIAMGIAGTDVTKEAGDIILTDDNFASIIAAIEEGRIVFKNTRQVSATLISTNFAEHITIISALIFLGGALPLLATQILWLNLITDGFAGVPLAAEPGHSEILKEKPRDKKEGVLTWSILPLLILTAVFMAVLALFAFNQYLGIGIEKGMGEEAAEALARTAAFSVIAFTQLFRALNMRDLKRSVFKIGFFRNKYLLGSILAALILQTAIIRIPFFQEVFDFKAIPIEEIFVLMALSSLIFFFGEIYKYIRYQLIAYILA